MKQLGLSSLLKLIKKKKTCTILLQTFSNSSINLLPISFYEKKTVSLQHLTLGKTNKQR